MRTPRPAAPAGRERTAGPWLVPVVALRRVTGVQQRERRSGRLPGLRVADTAVADDSTVEVDVTLTSIDGGIEATGTMGASWRARCRRCLRAVEGRIEVPVRELYSPGRAPRRAARRPPAQGAGPAPTGFRRSEPHPHQLRDEDGEETYPLGADHLDLEPLARDAVLLALPLAPLCRDDCPGWCPTCGADLDGGPCGCAVAPADLRWAALEQLGEHAGQPGRRSD